MLRQPSCSLISLELDLSNVTAAIAWPSAYGNKCTQCLQHDIASSCQPAQSSWLVQEGLDCQQGCTPCSQSAQCSFFMYSALESQQGCKPRCLLSSALEAPRSAACQRTAAFQRLWYLVVSRAVSFGAFDNSFRNPKAGTRLPTT